MKENKIANILFIIGIVQIVLGLILGLVVSAEEYTGYDANGVEQMQTGFDFATFLTWTVTGFVTGMLFIGFSEVIKLLHAINWKTPAPEPTSNEFAINTNPVSSDKVKQTFRKLDGVDEEKIMEYYTDEKVVEIIPSEMNGYCIVILEKGSEQFIRVVDIAGFGVKEVNDGEAKKRVMDWYNMLSE
ncbi:hypothetical protein ACFSTA_01580 [Ornithinibacillus salinisoli]|uniref:Uncharacterized protein n=1 Tax=Ornithinibacillus salinisoli TaxID=1848459 RepID=A0ABW4VTX4_9BACI